MLEGIDINERIEFVSKDDNTEPKTVFLFRPLSGSDMFSLKNKDEGFILSVLSKSIIEIKNIPKDIDKDDYLKSLRSANLNELFEKFNEINNISEDEEKN